MTGPDFDLVQWRCGRQLPIPTDLTRPFWDGLRDDRLMVQRCKSCDHHVFRPEYACTRCFASDLEWIESSGTGEVYSHSVVHRAPSPDMAVPYIVCVVEVDRRWHMMTNLVGCDHDEVGGGMPVRLRVVRIGDLAVPFFEPIRTPR